jgi:hypothetical protein
MKKKTLHCCRKLPTVALEHAGNSAQRAGVAQQVSPPDDAAGTKNRQGSDGSPTGGSSVLDDVYNSFESSPSK